nr:POTRA domain-containing protein [Pontibacter harenae]
MRFFFFIFLLLLTQAVAVAKPCQESEVVISNINFEGNDITKEQVLLLELTFQPGDTIATENLEAVLEESRMRLFNLRLFLHVTYNYTCDAGRVSVTYQMQERFYLYPTPIFDIADRNFAAWLEKKDWSRLDYGFSVVRRNFRGRNEDVRVRVQRGFNKRLELSYRKPYISRKHKLGLDVGVSDYRSRVIDYQTAGNRQYFFEQEERVPIKRTAASVGLLHRTSVQRQEGLRVTYQQEVISDSVAVLNPDYFREGLTERQFLRLDLYKVVNLRETFSYPLTGSYFEVALSHTFFLRNSGAPLTALRAKYVDYFRLNDNYYYTIGAEGMVKLANQYSYTDNRALGFRSVVRGYELYVINGQHYGLLKQGLSRGLLRNRQIHLNFINNPKFNNIPLSVYLNAFTDAGYVTDNKFENTNPLANRLLYGGGLGLHVVTFYDIVLRGEYALNREGDRGVYLSGSFPF